MSNVPVEISERYIFILQRFSLLKYVEKPADYYFSYNPSMDIVTLELTTTEKPILKTSVKFKGPLSTEYVDAQLRKVFK